MILPKIKVLRSHGKQYIPDLDAVELTEEFRGRPHLTETPDTADLERAAAICPTGALTLLDEAEFLRRQSRMQEKKAERMRREQWSAAEPAK